MDDMQMRREALEQRTHAIEQHLRWWRGLACGLMVLMLLTWALPAGIAQQQGLEQRVAALENLLIHFSRQGNEVFMTGANLHIVNGLGAMESLLRWIDLVLGLFIHRDECGRAL
jgi:hypothetical protein